MTKKKEKNTLEYFRRKVSSARDYEKIIRAVKEADA